MVERDLALARALAIAEAERIFAENERLRALNTDLLAALEGVRSYCIPGMNWTDEIGQELLAQADAALAKGRHEERE